MLDSPFPQPLSRSSLVFLLVLDPLLHTPCISSANHHLPFAAHAHTNAACSAVIPRRTIPEMSNFTSCNFHRKANSIFGKIDRRASAESVLQLIKEKRANIVIPIKDDTVAKTEPRIKSEIGCILWKVHVCIWPVVKYNNNDRPFNGL